MFGRKGFRAQPINIFSNLGEMGPPAPHEQPSRLDVDNDKEITDLKRNGEADP
jgi:hypothetical protein